MPAAKTLIRVPQDRERRATARMTGRYIVTAQLGAHQAVAGRLTSLGLKAATPLPPSATSARAMPRGSHLMLANTGIGLVDPPPELEDKLHAMAAEESAVLALEPERVVRMVGISSEYVRGWRDAVDALAAKLLLVEPEGRAEAAAAAAQATWGLVATRAIASARSGNGIKLAVLDTGFDLAHPDFAGRAIVTKNFVGDNQPFHDGVGHGTHCMGTAAGPQHPRGARYGIAYQATLYAGRVLDDTGHGGDFNILQGIDWAMEQGCDVISLSLEAPWQPGDPPFSQAYENAARLALTNGHLLVIAAGNDADDSRYVGAIGTPGNSPSALTVAANDQELATASFSNRVQVDAAGVKGPDICAPGVGIRSAWLVGEGGYKDEDGTSMATPHVAGIAALFAEANPGVRGLALKNLVLAHAKALANAAQRRGEIGVGLVQAP